MNRKAKTLIGLFVLGIGAALGAAESRAGHFSLRQYYSSWTYYPQQQYYTRYYYYQPAPTYTTYNYHVVYYYYNSYPNYYYYYNPYSNLYWGRTPIKSDKPAYSVLAEKDRKKDIKDIPESAFPAPTTPPAIPESTDKVVMEMPPKDTPSVPKN